MAHITLTEIASEDNFNEESYLVANPDVAEAVRQRVFESAFAHFTKHGKLERRTLRNSHRMAQMKDAKRAKIRTLLRDDMPLLDSEGSLDFLTDDLRAAFNIIPTENVSSHNYREEGLALIEKHAQGLILDCGAGQRPVYYDNVVNFEIENYDTTDVRGVGEKLPFKDNSFDAVFSLAVLEHVKDPFQCAREITRVLKPGGDLLCVVPFLQPMHGYPNHYYNMTKQGIRNLFEPNITIQRHEVRFYTLPIWTLTWIVNSWAEGLTGPALDEFLNLKIADLRNHPETYLQKPFVTQLSEDKNFELASGTTIWGTKNEV